MVGNDPRYGWKRSQVWLETIPGMVGNDPRYGWNTIPGMAWKVVVIVFFDKSIGVGPFVYGTFCDFWATFEPFFGPLFLGVFKGANFAFFWPFKK
jgi:hypothetical protein